jgi:hypothetical protein
MYTNSAVMKAAEGAAATSAYERGLVGSDGRLLKSLYKFRRRWFWRGNKLAGQGEWSTKDQLGKRCCTVPESSLGVALRPSSPREGAEANPLKPSGVEGVLLLPVSPLNHAVALRVIRCSEGVRVA